MNSCKTDIFFSNYYHLQSFRFESKKLTDGQSNLLLSNQAHALDGTIDSVMFPRLHDTRAFLLLNHLEIFSCILLISNHMIFLVQFGINRHL